MNVSNKALDAARLVLGKCAANDPWFPNPSDATLFAWAEQFMIANLATEDLSAAVTKVYGTHGSGFKPLAADILAAAREIRRERAARRSADELADRDAVIDQKAAAENRAALAEVGAMFVGGKVPRTPRLEAAEAAIQEVTNRETAMAAMREFFAAKAESAKGVPA